MRIYIHIILILFSYKTRAKDELIRQLEEI